MFQSEIEMNVEEEYCIMKPRSVRVRANANPCGRRHLLTLFVALACLGCHMSLNVDATTYRVYIGATTVPPYPISSWSWSIRI